MDSLRDEEFFESISIIFPFDHLRLLQPTFCLHSLYCILSFRPLCMWALLLHIHLRFQFRSNQPTASEARTQPEREEKSKTQQKSIGKERSARSHVIWRASATLVFVAV